MRKKISAESVIAGTIASLRHSKHNAYDIAKSIIRDLKHFGYGIQRNSDGDVSETIKQKGERSSD